MNIASPGFVNGHHLTVYQGSASELGPHSSSAGATDRPVRRQEVRKLNAAVPSPESEYMESIVRLQEFMQEQMLNTRSYSVQVDSTQNQLLISLGNHHGNSRLTIRLETPEGDSSCSAPVVPVKSTSLKEKKPLLLVATLACANLGTYSMKIPMCDSEPNDHEEPFMQIGVFATSDIVRDDTPLANLFRVWLTNSSKSDRKAVDYSPFISSLIPYFGQSPDGAEASITTLNGTKIQISGPRVCSFARNTIFTSYMCRVLEEAAELETTRLTK